MLHSVFDARRFNAGAVQTALASPIAFDDRPRSIGPFFVVAHALPFEIGPGELQPDFDVRPHPHIGLAAASYIYEGHITHRDSLGSRSEVEPGGLHYMIAGRGVVHSERFDRLRTLGGKLEMLQILLALPNGTEEAEPSFVHVGPASIPRQRIDGVEIRCLAGVPSGATEVIAFPSPVFFHDVRLQRDGRYAVPEAYPERAIYVVSGSVHIDGTQVASQQTAVLSPGEVTVCGAEHARIVAFGGESVGPRYMWWNFIHSSLDRIEEAKAEWRAGRTPLPPGDTESFTPAPPDDGRPLHHLNAYPLCQRS